MLDDDRIVAPGSKNPHVGLIELHFYTYQVPDREPDEARNWETAKDPGLGTSIIHERDKIYPGHNVE